MRIFSSDEIKLAAQELLFGEPIAFPTETVYGLGAPVFNEECVRKIFELKGRPSDNPLIVHISYLAQVELLAINIPDDFYKLAEKFFPGPLSIVLKKSPRVPNIVSAGLDSVAIRMPKHPIALELIENVGQPIAAPSANLSGKPSSTEISHISRDFEDRLAGVIDGGTCDFGLESTVISLIDKPALLRPGSISREELEDALSVKLGKGQKERSPGTRYKHYSPKAKVSVVFSQQELTDERALILASEDPRYEHFSEKSLYNWLRQADILGYKHVVFLCGEKARKNEALMDRIVRAASE